MPYRPNFPIPDDIYAEPFCLCIRVPNDPVWKQVVAGLLDELNQWYNWQRDEAKSGKDCAQVWRNLYNEIDWTTMSCCCDNPPDVFKYVDGVLYRSTDGGDTFSPAEDFDIRINPSVIFPEPPDEEGVDELCLAADGMVNLIKEQIGENLTEDMSRYTLNELIKNWVETMIGTSNPFTALVTIVANQIFALIIGSVIAALTDEVYQLLRCIFFNNMLPDKSFDVTGWESVRSDILDQITGIAGVFLEHLVYLLGSGGLTNLARSMAGVDDSACCPACDADNWNIVTYSGTDVGLIVSRTSNSITVQGTSHPDFGTPYNAMIQSTSDDTCCVASSIELISGTLPLYFGVDCGNARWPGSPNGPFTVGVSNVNTLFVRGDTAPFVVKITFA